RFTNSLRDCSAQVCGSDLTLSVAFTPTDAANYTTASKTVSINVVKATPVITWTTPADIIYGTALGATQLNASASVAGTFVYTPRSEERRVGRASTTRWVA